MYRWHVKDPIRYRHRLDKFAIQQTGRKKGPCERVDDWYQVEPHNPVPRLPDRAARTANIDVVPKAEK